MTLLTTALLFQEVNLSHNQMTQMKDLSVFCCLRKLDLGCILSKSRQMHQSFLVLYEIQVL